MFYACDVAALILTLSSNVLFYEGKILFHLIWKFFMIAGEESVEHCALLLVGLAH